MSPYTGVSIFSQALVIEAVDLRNLARLEDQEGRKADRDSRKEGT
jgi:hypothetical protein